VYRTNIHINIQYKFHNYIIYKNYTKFVQKFSLCVYVHMNNTYKRACTYLTFRRPAFKILKYNDFGDYFPVKVF